MELHEGGHDEQHTGAHWERLAPGVARCRLPGWDATAGAVAGTAGVLVVDAGGSPAEGAGVRRGAEGLFGLPVTHVALTHPHFDHVLGASAFPGAVVHGTTGDAEELCRDAVAYGVPAGAARDAAGRLPAARPVDGEREIGLGGGRRVRLVALGAAHSPDDLVVLVPGDPAVVFCGDLVEESGEPQAGPDASPGRWPAALDRLLELGGEDAVYVPGHGAVVDARFVREQRNALARRFGVS
ncbi:MBL fold metallo-hydrolase [Streptomyces caatingaensis]|uniref:Metallo-beta-lactamase n=1 Tax=Streptomyces caatingaensis TaxID=1678637 RepID=A0A0K9XI90_9ACTN|nr:MBL fold metallo-hydrolase [Streptomyces caatingaensis]KNB53018.1 metallo-beta-lactamase [Streptomyces caatingaensis]